MFLKLIFHPTQCSNFCFSSISSQTPVLADTSVLSSVLTKGARLNVPDKNILHALTLLQLQIDLVQTSKPRFSSREPLRKNRGVYSLLMFFHTSDNSGVKLTRGLDWFPEHQHFIELRYQFMAIRSTGHWQLGFFVAIIKIIKDTKSHRWNPGGQVVLYINMKTYGCEENLYISLNTAKWK